MLNFEPGIVHPADPLVLHTAKPAAEPAVKVPELSHYRRELGSVVPRVATDDGVDPLHNPGVQVVTTYGQFSHPIFESLQGFGPDFASTVSDRKTQEDKALLKLCNFRFLWTEPKSQSFDASFGLVSWH